MLLKGRINLFFTLNNGQVFHWKQESNNVFVGVVNGHVMKLIGREDGILVEDLNLDDPWSNEVAGKVIYDYFQLGVNMDNLYTEWGKNCNKMKDLCKKLDGMKIIKQDPFECLISFILSSNNNIPRIRQMNEKLRKRYGSLINIKNPSSNEYYSFPTAQQLVANATEEELRKMGFGYRAKYILGTVNKIIQSKINLNSLADLGSKKLIDTKTRLQVRESLMQFPGVGAKVADCTSLFSMNQTMTIPVDTHVLQIAQRDFAAGDRIKDIHKEMEKPVPKSLTPVIYEIIGDIFREKYGKYSGWAHCFLFAAELPQFQPFINKKLVQEVISSTVSIPTTSEDKKRPLDESDEIKIEKKTSKKKRTT